MDAVNAPRTQLDYAPPLQPNAVDIRRAADGIDVLVGPMPAWVFVTAILPHAFLLAAVAVLVGWTFYPPRRAVSHDLLLIGLVTGVSVLGAAVNVALLLRHRLIPRALGASPGSIYFSDARTGGKPRRFVAADISAIGVRRRWWCPWILELVAVPRYQLLTFRKQTTAPIVLLAGLDRATLQQIASDLREMLKSRSDATSAVSTPSPPAT